MKQVSRCPPLRYGAELSGLAISSPPHEYLFDDWMASSEKIHADPEKCWIASLLSFYSICSEMGYQAYCSLLFLCIIKFTDYWQMSPWFELPGVVRTPPRLQSLPPMPQYIRSRCATVNCSAALVFSPSKAQCTTAITIRPISVMHRITSLSRF